MPDDGVVPQADIKRRTDKKSEEYAPYSLLYLSFVTFVARSWHQIGPELVVADADIRDGSVQAHAAAMMKVNNKFESLFNSDESISHNLCFDKTLWARSNDDEKGYSVGCTSCMFCFVE